MKKTWIALLLALCMLTTIGSGFRLLHFRLLHEAVRNGRGTDHGGNLHLHHRWQGHG